MVVLGKKFHDFLPSIPVLKRVVHPKVSCFTLVLSINMETQCAISCILAHQVTKALSSFAVKVVGGPNCLIVTLFILQL